MFGLGFEWREDCSPILTQKSLLGRGGLRSKFLFDNKVIDFA